LAAIYYVLGAKQHKRICSKGERRPRDVIGTAVRVMRIARVSRAAGSSVRPPRGVPSGSSLKQSNGDGDAIGLLVATALPARDHATIVPFDPGCHRAAALPWADGDATLADAHGDV
jgi:hypothetical protein